MKVYKLALVSLPLIINLSSIVITEIDIHNNYTTNIQ